MEALGTPAFVAISAVAAVAIATWLGGGEPPPGAAARHVTRAPAFILPVAFLNRLDRFFRNVLGISILRITMEYGRWTASQMFGPGRVD